MLKKKTMDILGKDPIQYYNKETAKKYHRSGAFRRIQYKITRRALELLQAKKDTKIIDLGCGTGFSLDILEDEGFEARGIDIAPEMIKFAKEKGHIVQVADIRNLPFEAESFDYALSISALQWTKEDTQKEYAAYAKEIYRILKKEGKAIIHFYPQSELEFETAIQMFKEAKFQVECIVDKGASHQKADRKFLLLSKK